MYFYPPKQNIWTRTLEQGAGTMSHLSLSDTPSLRAGYLVKRGSSLSFFWLAAPIMKCHPTNKGKGVVQYSYSVSKWRVCLMHIGWTEEGIPPSFSCNRPECILSNRELGARWYMLPACRSQEESPLRAGGRGYPVFLAASVWNWVFVSVSSERKGREQFFVQKIQILTAPEH